jgi:hypothetical protein
MDEGWVLDIGKEDAMPSIKNCRLDAFGRTYCYIRKIEKNQLEIEVRTIIDEMAVFAIAIGLFLCHKYFLNFK